MRFDNVVRPDGDLPPRVLRSLAAAWAEFWSLLFPTECVVCQRPDVSLCVPCRKRLRKATVRPFRAEEAAESLPETATGELLPVVAAGIYRRELSQALLAYKNRGHTDLCPTLGTVLAGALHHAVDELARPDREVLLVPVPSTPAARRRRGYEPVYSLLHRLERGGMLPRKAVCSRALALPPWWWRVFVTAESGAGSGAAVDAGADAGAGGGTPGDGRWRQEVAYRVARRFRSQKGLGASARRSNVRNTMLLRRRWRKSAGLSQSGRFDCLIVDDVLTTGATLSEAARALHDGGANVLGAVVIAATPSPKWARS